MTFSDQTPFDARVVKDNFDSIIAMGPTKALLSYGYLTGYQSAIAVNAQTVTVNFSQPNVQFLESLSETPMILYSESTLKQSLPQRCQGKLVGTGPFVLQDFDGSTGARLTRRDGYNWASSLAKHSGTAYLSGIQFKVVPDSGVRGGQQKSGEIDVDTIPQTDVLATLKSAGIQSIGRLYPGVNVGFTPNLQRPLMQDPTIRQAIQLGIDRQQVVSGVLSSYDKVATGVLASTTPLFTPSTGLVTDPKKAEQLLQADGWVAGADGIRSKGGTRLTILALYSTIRGSSSAVQLVQQQLRTIGIDLQVQDSTTGAAAGLLASGKYDLNLGQNIRAEPDALRSSFAFDALNLGKAPAPRPVDAVLDSTAVQTNSAKRQQLISQASQELIDAGYSIPIWQMAAVMTFSGKVHGLALNASSRLNLYDVWKAS